MSEKKWWFPNGYIATMSFRKPDRYDAAFKRVCFDTWQEAHAYMLERAKLRLKRADAELRSAMRHAGKVAAMQPDNRPGAAISDEAGTAS